ncbi:hypothetical protein RRG08_049534, partial [Elysia crispata]
VNEIGLQRRDSGYEAKSLDYENSEDMRKEGPTADRLGSIKMRRTLDQEGNVKHGPIGSKT